MSRKILKMCIESREMEINMSGYSDDAIDTISTFIDHINDECYKAGMYFDATLYETTRWNDDSDKLHDVKEKVDEYICGDPYNSIFTINNGENLPFGVAARLQTEAKLDEDAIINEYGYMISNIYYDKMEASQYVCFRDGFESNIPKVVKDMMEKIYMDDNK